MIPAREARHSSRAVRAGELIPVLRGVYAPAAAWRDLAPWDQYLARVHAAVLRYPDAVLCLESAACHRGLPTFGDPGTVHFLVGEGEKSRVSGGIVVHTTRDTRVIEEIDGILVTSLTDTVVDLARSRHNAIGLAVADAALRQGPNLTAAHLRAANEVRLTSRGRRHARWPLERATHLAESPLESVDRSVIEWLGFPAPELQVRIGPDRVDKWWARLAIAGESDGEVKYGGSVAERAAALRDRRDRDARLIRNGARAVPHWGWHEALAADPLHAVLVAAGLRSVGVRNTAQLFSLARALRRPAVS